MAKALSANFAAKLWGYLIILCIKWFSPRKVLLLLIYFRCAVEGTHKSRAKWTRQWIKEFLWHGHDRASLYSTDCSIGPKKLHGKQKIRLLEDLLTTYYYSYWMFPWCWAPIKIPKDTANSSIHPPAKIKNEKRQPPPEGER